MPPEPAPSLSHRLHALVGVGLLAGVVIALIVAFTAGGDKPLRAGAPVPGARDVQALLDGIPQQGLVLGDPHAPVTLVEFADLQCPFCRAFSQDSLPGLVRDLVRPGRLQVIFRAVPALGPDSLRAARAAGAAAQGNRLWQFVDLFYRNQGSENSGYVTDAFMRQIARGAGAPYGAVDPGIARTRELVHTYGLDVTPSFLIGPTGTLKLKRVGDAGEIRAEVKRLAR